LTTLATEIRIFSTENTRKAQAIENVKHATYFVLSAAIRGHQKL
jgi:hypothetical protein